MKTVDVIRREIIILFEGYYTIFSGQMEVPPQDKEALLHAFEHSINNAKQVLSNFLEVERLISRPNAKN